MAERNATAATLAKVARLLASAREHHERTGEVIAEIEALLGGQAGIATQVKQFETTFDGLWCARYTNGETGRYVWAFVRDRPQIKRLLKGLGLEELERRAAVYLASDDRFYARSRHGFSLFISSINTYAAPAEVEDFSLRGAPTNCHHDPRCRTDVDHTRRRRLECRALPVGSTEPRP